MTKAEAIQQLLKCDWLEIACKNIGKQDWEDLHQEFWVKILEQPEATFESIRNLQFFCVRIILNANTDKFRRAKKITETGPEPIEFDENELHRALQQKDTILGGLPYYDRFIFKLHESGLSCREISRWANINRNEVNKTVNRVKEYIAQNVRYNPA